MFTKYNGINLPNNYSGTKFKQPIEDTNMKTHRAQDERPITRGVVRTSVSPSFQGALDKAVEKASSENYAPVNEVFDSYVNDPLATDTQDEGQFEKEAIDNEGTIDGERASDAEGTIDGTSISAPKKRDNSTFGLLNELGLGHLFESIHKDDLLLIALIILFAQEHLQDSLDAIVILALLLLYH